MKLLISYLQQADASLLTSGLGHRRLLLVVTDCVWCTVVGNPVVEDIFLEEGGVFCLLDLLQVNHMRHHCPFQYPFSVSLYIALFPKRGRERGLGKT